MNDFDKYYIIYEEGMIIEEIEKPGDMKVGNETHPEKFKSLKVLDVGIDNTDLFRERDHFKCS